jgi:hypothetical protein
MKEEELPIGSLSYINFKELDPFGDRFSERGNGVIRKSIVQ